MVPSIASYISLLRAVDRDGSESSNLAAWSLTSTDEIAARCGMTRQKATPLLWSLLSEGYVTRCQQPDQSVTWHLGDSGVRLLRAETEIAIWRPPGMSRPVGTIGATS